MNEDEESMTKSILYEYIKNKKCFCHLCSELKQKVLKDGVKALDNYDGMICGGIEDMMRRKFSVRDDNPGPART